MDAFGIAPMGGPIITFRKVSILNQFRSGQAGSPQFDVKDYIKIETPGDTSQITDREVKPHEIRQYATQWEQYQNQQEQVQAGTPMLFLFPSEPDLVDHLKGLKFHTIEQLSEAADTQVQNMMGGFDYREKAKKFLAFSKDSAKFHQVHKSLADKDYKIDEQAKLIALMKARLDEVEARLNGGAAPEAEPQRRGPGRPRNDAAA